MVSGKAANYKNFRLYLDIEVCIMNIKPVHMYCVTFSPTSQHHKVGLIIKVPRHPVPNLFGPVTPVIYYCNHVDGCEPFL